MSDFQVIEPTDTQQMRAYLAEIGASLSDVFGADNILWVEGKTEEECFPIILSKVAKRPLLGTAIVGVVNTGDFEGKQARGITEIYKRLSSGKGLIPPAIGFVFDREQKNQQQISDLEKQSNHAIRFINRSLFENYLLHPQAIAERINVLDDLKTMDVTAEQVEEWLKNKREDHTPANKKRYKIVVSKGDDWKKTIHGARLLDDCFNELTGHRVNYDKTRDAKQLTLWLAENAPEELEELTNLLTSILDAIQAPS